MTNPAQSPEAASEPLALTAVQQSEPVQPGNLDIDGEAIKVFDLAIASEAEGKNQPKPVSRLWQHWIVTAVWAIVITGFWSWVALSRFYRFDSDLDITIFHQAIKSAAQFQPPYVLAKGDGFPLWADHFHPILLVCVPFYWIWPHAETLLILQACCIGAASFILTRAGLKHAGLPGFILGAAAGISPGISWGLQFDFHEVALGLPIVALAVAAFLDQRYRSSALWFATLLLVKEDMSLVVIGAGIALLWRRQRWLGIGLASGAAIWTVLITQVVIPAISPLKRYWYSDKIKLAEIPAALDKSLLHPGLGTVTGVILLAAVGFLAHRSVLFWGVALSYLARMVSANELFWLPHFHYNMIVAVLLSGCAVDALASSKRSGQPAKVQFRMLVVLAMIVLTLKPVAGQLTEPADQEKIAAAKQAIALVPPGEKVAADSALTCHFSQTDRVYLQQSGPMLDVFGNGLNVSWLIFDTSLDHATTMAYIQRLQEEGWEQKYERSNYVVMHKK